ncbi:hypothetical protein Aoki45_00170 [Algoriphagus sp. oki45]|uniref:hypothetical protein n=1 Tax=Algoriphagus sp. oki45 TaxID=3067294 RepID=UPI0027F92D39|nr:hypothetical protein Aoki45_00170 [Algoriphagus sp. oki45]
MQEDNLDKWLAKNLRRHQENDPVPYEEGAWEAFQAKRSGAGFKIAYWAGGIAASLLIFLMAYFAMDLGKSQESISNEMELLTEERTTNVDQEEVMQEQQNQANSGNSSENLALKSETKKEPSFSSNEEKEDRNPRGETTRPKVIEPSKPIDNQVAKKTIGSTLQANPSPAQPERKESSLMAQIAPDNAGQKDSVTQAKVEELKKQIAELTGAEEKQPASSDEYRTRTLSLGLSPGVGSSQSNNQSTSGTSLGLGAQVNWALGEKLALGSGMGVNFFNQSSQGESSVQIANASYPVRQEVQVSQVQVDVPVYLTYPVNRKQSIAIQAGFSNLMAFTSNAQQENSYLRQVAVFDAQSSSSNDFTLRTESVSSLSSVDTPSSRFIPFATANLGVNILVLESKKTAYLLMPFYNYPLQDISGTGTNPGFFGAALKVNFGTIQKK